MSSVSDLQRLMERLAEYLRRQQEAPCPFLVVLAGPNGAGKSTFHRSFLAWSGLPFVNADEIAREMGPATDPVALAQAAGDQATRLRETLVATRESFVFETVFSDPEGDKVGFLKRARAQGFVVFLVFIGLESPTLSQGRVIQRVARGGHDVPSEKLVERFPRVQVNLERGAEFVDYSFVFDNSLLDDPYRLLACLEKGRVTYRAGDLPSWARALAFLRAPS